LKVKADIAVIYAKSGNVELAKALLADLATDNSENEIRHGAGKVSVIVNAYVELGDLDRALVILREASSNSNPRKGRIAVTIADADKGEIKAAIKAAAEIVSPRYHALALCKAARKFAEQEDIEFARTALMTADKCAGN
jgi:hypothetical protein